MHWYSIQMGGGSTADVSAPDRIGCTGEGL